MSLLTHIIALLTLWVVCPILLSFGLVLIFRQWKADRERKRKWAEEGVKQHSVRNKQLYIERVK